MPLLTVSGVHVQEAGTTILKDISFNQQEGQRLVIAGETGSGKSTLLQTVAGLVQASAGTVYLNGSKVEGPHDKLVPGHPDIAYLSQQFELPQFLRVEQVLQYSNTLSEAEAQKLYEICRISHLARRRTNQLSGGERQRIALARLLSSWPELLLLDEPYSNLDMGHKSTLKAVIRDISQELGISLILISHDPLDTLSWADEILVMQHGQLIQKGTPEQIYRQPVNAYAASLFGKYNLVPAAAAKRLFNLEHNGASHLLLRPENIQLETDAPFAAKGVVTAVHYFGSYYELDVQLEDERILIRTSENKYATGDTVTIALNPKDVWWV